MAKAKQRAKRAADDGAQHGTRRFLMPALGAGVTAATALAAGAARAIAVQRASTSRSRVAMLVPLGGALIVGIAAIAGRRRGSAGTPPA